MVNSLAIARIAISTRNLRLSSLRLYEKVETCSLAVPSEVGFWGCNDDLLHTILTSIEEKYNLELFQQTYEGI